MVRRDIVRGHNDATYDIVPKQDQLFNVEFLEIAPTPIIADRVFFVYLRGYLPESTNTLALYDKGLVDATLTVSGSVIYPDGRYEDPRSLTIP
ncbi:uncharacterized protein N7473_011933 [Penicillium subrubescens]|uniref:uncharacterized protein n=1 Tax=Penicillium subrubescens TaxID=1316194 RepID=UPI002545AED1|nr:uncharacterized protein N7473_011933 [Penicillium subrubescens]KAJ5880880.1 hypothetical protein N7473_011933 [Penicillium subrubescens]